MTGSLVEFEFSNVRREDLRIALFPQFFADEIL
jgi:hypothetical protein